MKLTLSLCLMLGSFIASASGDYIMSGNRIYTGGYKPSLPVSKVLTLATNDGSELYTATVLDKKADNARQVARNKALAACMIANGAGANCVEVSSTTSLQVYTYDKEIACGLGCWFGGDDTAFKQVSIKLQQADSIVTVR